MVLDVFLENIGDLAIKPTHVFEPCLDDFTVTDGTQQSMQKLLPNQCFTKCKQNIYPMTYLKGDQYGIRVCELSSLLCWYGIMAAILFQQNNCKSPPLKLLQLLIGTPTCSYKHKGHHLPKIFWFWVMKVLLVLRCFKASSQ